MKRMARRLGVLALGGIVGATGCGAAGEGPVDSRRAGKHQPPAPTSRARPIAPISGSLSFTRRPVLRWRAEDPARVEICADRECKRVISTSTGHDQARPAEPLPPGIVFWRVREAHGPGAVSATWQLRIPAADTDAPGVWGALPDYNGDGYADVAVGAVPPGGVWVFFGGPAGLGHTPGQILGEGEPRFGQEVTPAGDVDGDGFMDLAISGTPSPDEVTIYQGGPEGLTRGATLNGRAPTFGFVSLPAIRLVARAMSTAGDENGDGYADLLVGETVRGHLFRGGPAGIDPDEDPRLVMPDGIVVAGGADFDGDGIPDAVGGNLFRGTGAGFVQVGNEFFNGGAFIGNYDGDRFADYARPSALVQEAGPVFGGGEILAGSPTGLHPIAQIASRVPFGAAGDVNGDGRHDAIALIQLFVGVPARHQLFALSAGGPPVSSFEIAVPGHLSSDPTDTPLLRGVGDVDGDGFDDLMAGAPDTGDLYLFRGSREGVRAPQRIASSYPGLGISIAGL